MTHAEFSHALLQSEATPPSDIRFNTGSDRSCRFAVYRNNVMVMLIDALIDSYPVVRALVGDEFFRFMARQFAQQHPPVSPVMAEYGSGFAEFIAAFPAAVTLPYLPDVARLEWQRVIAWHAADAPSLTAADVALLLNDPDVLMRTHWQFHPSLALVDSRFSIVSIWQAHQHASAIEVEASLERVDVLEPESALVMRQDLTAVILNLSQAEAAFVASLQSGRPLAASVENAQKASPEFDLSLMFALLMQSGALQQYQIPADQ